MIDHITIGVSHFARSMAFYDTVLDALGMSRLVGPLAPEDDPVPICGFGLTRPSFWLVGEKPVSGLLHIAFEAPTRPAVDAFHIAALRAGGRDNGAPGLRPRYHPDYYAAFIRDPDGHNIEAVCHGAAPGRPA